MAFHLANPVLSRVYFSLVRLELQISTNMQCIHGSGHRGVGCSERDLFRWKKNSKLSSLGEKRLRSGTEKIGFE